MIGTEAPETMKVIGPLERCDRCIAKAVFMVVFNNGDLYFCAHHFREHEDNFIESALDIYDEHDEVLVNPSALDEEQISFQDSARGCIPSTNAF